MTRSLVKFVAQTSGTHGLVHARDDGIRNTWNDGNVHHLLSGDIFGMSPPPRPSSHHPRARLDSGTDNGMQFTHSSPLYFRELNILETSILHMVLRTALFLSLSSSCHIFICYWPARFENSTSTSFTMAQPLDAAVFYKRTEVTNILTEFLAADSKRSATSETENNVRVTQEQSFIPRAGPSTPPIKRRIRQLQADEWSNIPTPGFFVKHKYVPLLSPRNTRTALEEFQQNFSSHI